MLSSAQETSFITPATQGEKKKKKKVLAPQTWPYTLYINKVKRMVRDFNIATMRRKAFSDRPISHDSEKMNMKHCLQPTKSKKHTDPK